jgi:hypothetical protein
MAEWHQVRPNPDVLFSDLGEGGILFDLNSKQYFSLNRSAAEIWNYLDAGGSLAQLEAELASRGGASQAESEGGLREFAEFLTAHRLVEVGAAEGSAPLPSILGAWERPRIEQHGNPLSDVILSPFDPTVPIPE